jgi:hypothetical protein
MHGLEFNAAFLHSELTGFERAFSQSPPLLLVAAFVLPIILAAWSRRLGVFLGSLVMASAAFAAMIEPSSVALIIAVGTYLISLVLALSGIFARRRDHRMRDELRNVQSKLDDLIRAYETRLLAELKTTATPTAMAAKSRDEKTSS